MQELEDKIHEINGIARIRLNAERALMPPNDYLITGDIKERRDFRRYPIPLKKTSNGYWACLIRSISALTRRRWRSS